MKKIAIIGGGTVFHVRNHLALTAPAYGKTAQEIKYAIYAGNDDDYKKYIKYDVNMYLTKMAGGNLETNQDVSNLLDKLIADTNTRIVFFNPALVDYEGYICANENEVGWDIPTMGNESVSGKYESRLKTSDGQQMMILTPADKLVGKIRKTRKDIFLVAFKTTCGATEDEQFLAGLNLLKSSSCNLVLANDTKTRKNMIITPEQARYCVTTNRKEVIKELVSMAVNRAEGTFTRSTVVEGHSIGWDSPLIPESLRTVVDHCIAKGAYKPFKGATVGHFAVKVSDTEFVTSKRKVNFNELNKVGMVFCESESDNKVIAYGARPSVGGQSQRIIFKEHPETDCILHFHCKPKAGKELSVRTQRNFECGSHQCGKNTSDGLKEEVPGIKCVYLDNHGPNIVFNRYMDPAKVIEFIDENFDLSKSTDGVDRSVSTL